MLRRLVVVSLLVTCVGLGFPPWAGEIATAGAASAVSIEANLCYEPSGASCAGGVSHEFDAYLPAGVTQETPGVILIHGGGFTGGDKSDLANLGNKLAADGMAAFSINYRLDSSTVVGFPMESQDVMAAISYIRRPRHIVRRRPHSTRLLRHICRCDARRLFRIEGISDRSFGASAR